MIRFVLVLLAAGVAAVTFLDSKETSAKTVLAYDDYQVNSSLNDGRLVYQIASDNGASCQMVSRLDKAGIVSVSADKSCEGVVQGLGSVSQWISGAQGSISLKDANDNTVLAIQSSDGFAYEATTDENVQISFQIIDR